MAMEMFKSQTGVNMIRVPYRGGALSLADVAAGQVPITMSDYSGGGMIRGGKVRPLAVADTRRIPVSVGWALVPTVTASMVGTSAHPTRRR
jgi:tripartite-type tricarboxylate transporter receptor subunit TctC